MGGCRFNPGLPLIFSNRTTKKHEKSPKNKVKRDTHRDASNLHFDEDYDEEDEGFEEFMIIEILEEEEDIE